MIASMDMPKPPVAYIQRFQVDSNTEHEQICYTNKIIDNAPINPKPLGNNAKIKIEKDEAQKLHIAIVYGNESFSFDKSITVSLQKEITFRVENGNPLLKCHRWGCGCSTDSDMEKALARQFSQLSEKAFRDKLSEDESIYWKNIIEDIDYRKYSFDSMSPYYITARVESIKKNNIAVRCFVDNSLMHIKGEALQRGSFWNKGDAIGMFVKFDMHGNITFIEHASIIDAEISSKTWYSDIEVIRV